jgi:hypothetical protein
MTELMSGIPWKHRIFRNNALILVRTITIKKRAPNQTRKDKYNFNYLMCMHKEI